MRYSLIFGAVISALSISTVASAQSAPEAKPLQVKVGEWVRTSDGATVGRIQYVDKAKDGGLKDVGVIYDMRMVHIPADTLSAAPKGYVTSLARADVNKLN